MSTAVGGQHFQGGGGGVAAGTYVPLDGSQAMTGRLTAPALTLTQVAATSLTPVAALLLTLAAHTGLASAEATDVDINAARTVTFASAGGTIANQRFVRVRQPTLAAGAALTFTQASTVEIDGPPVAGSNVTLTALDALRLTTGNLTIASGRLTVARNSLSTGTPSAVIGVTGGTHTGLTNAEYSAIDFNFAQTVTFTGGGGAIADLRSVRLRAPTLAAAAAQTITDAATLAIDGAPAAGSNMTLTRTWGIASGRDTDTAHVFGRCLLHSVTTDLAMFAHYDRSTTGGYAIRQSSTGGTIVSGATVQFAINDSSVVTVAAGVLTPVTSAGATLGSATLPWGGLMLAEVSAPTGTANVAKLYCQDNAGKSQLYVIFGSGAAQLLATEP